MSQAIQILQRAQHVEVIDGLGKLALFHHWPDKDRRNLVAACVVIFVPGNDQQAVVGLGELNVATEVLLQPGVALRDRTVVHVIVEIWIDDGNRWQIGEIGWEAAERQV